jgi:TolB-like protein/Tfp pilus assembly protein PilF
MSEVYRARDTRLGREVAVKVVGKEFCARFQTEAHAIAALNHPNICTLFDVGPNYLVMELVEGESLADRLKKGALSSEESVRIATDIADALAAAHAKGMAHRDLKPQNVMITREGRVKLLDFGLAKMFDSADDAGANDVTRTVEGAIVGTVPYMSPEQIQSQPVGPPSDIYSFGAVLYEMLSGRRAFPAGIARDEPQPLSQINPNLSAIVTRCLRPAPQDRFPTMGEVKSALDRTHTAPADSGPSIAVLPFANMSGEKDSEYFSDGLAEDVLNALTRVKGLKVTARTSAFSFRGKDLDIRKIGEALGVKAILEGSVRQAGNRIRVTVQLIDVSNGYHVWSERYDRDMTDVFAVQDEISAAIVDALKLKFAHKKHLHRPVNMEAYHALLRARHYMWTFNPQNMERGLKIVEEAIALDPAYASPYAFRALSLMLLAQLGPNPSAQTLAPARASALKALELDETLSEAHGVLTVASSLAYDWRDAHNHYRSARVEDPLIGGLCAVAFLLPSGRYREAQEFLETLIARDPLAPMPRAGMGMALCAMGDLEGSKTAAQHLIELHEKEFNGYLNLALLLTLEGKIRESIEVLERATKLVLWFPPLWGLLAANYRQAGEHEKATAIFQMPVMNPNGAAIANLGLGIYHTAVSELDEAASYFERAIDNHQFGAFSLPWSPFFKELRATPRGQALLARMNLPSPFSQASVNTR